MNSPITPYKRFPKIDSSQGIKVGEDPIVTKYLKRKHLTLNKAEVILAVENPLETTQCLILFEYLTSRLEL